VRASRGDRGFGPGAGHADSRVTSARADAEVAPAVDPGEQRAAGDAVHGQVLHPAEDRADRAECLGRRVVDPPDDAARGLVGFRCPDGHGQALARDVLDVADAERGEFRAAGKQDEPEQDDRAVAQPRRRLQVAGRDDRRQVLRHDGDGLARPVPAAAGGLAALRGDHDLPCGERVRGRRPGAAVHGPDRRQVRVGRCRLQAPVHGQVGEVRGHGLRGGRQRDPPSVAAPGLERPPPRLVRQGGVLRHRLPDQRGGLGRERVIGAAVGTWCPRSLCLSSNLYLSHDMNNVSGVSPGMLPKLLFFHSIYFSNQRSASDRITVRE
jgi:hypothetical protein